MVNPIDSYKKSFFLLRGLGSAFEGDATKKARELAKQIGIPEEQVEKDIKEAALEGNKKAYEISLNFVRAYGSVSAYHARENGEKAAISKEQIEKDIKEAALEGDKKAYETSLSSVKTFGSLWTSGAREKGEKAGVSKEQLEKDIKEAEEAHKNKKDSSDANVSKPSISTSRRPFLTAISTWVQAIMPISGHANKSDLDAILSNVLSPSPIKIEPDRVYKTALSLARKYGSHLESENAIREFGKKAGIPEDQIEKDIKEAISNHAEDEKRDESLHFFKPMTPADTERLEKIFRLAEKMLAGSDAPSYPSNWSSYVIGTTNDESFPEPSVDSLRDWKLVPVGGTSFIAPHTIKENHTYPDVLDYGSRSPFPRMSLNNASSFEELFGEGLNINLSNLSNEYKNRIKERYVRGLVREGASPLIQDVFNSAFTFHVDKNDYSGIQLAARCCVALAKYNPPEAILKNYINAVAQGTIKTKEESIKLLKETTVQAAAITLFRSTNELEREEARNFIKVLAKADRPIVKFNVGYEDEKRVLEQSGSTIKRLFNVHHGFSALKFETRRPPSKKPPLLARFGKDTARQVKYIHAKDINSFPGKGILISGLIPEKLFIPDLKAEKKGEDPFHTYKKAWAYLKNEFDDMKNTHYLFTRGMVVVSCPGNDKFELTNKDGKKAHYSLVITNDHFHGNTYNRAFLIPTEVIQKKLKGSTIPYEDYPAIPKDTKDINETGMKIEDLINASREMGAYERNVGSLSNLNGGLCNSLPLDSEPLFAWEKEKRNRGYGTDLWGRINKSYTPGSNLEGDLWTSLRKEHDDVARVTDGYLNLLDLFMLGNARFHKGFTQAEAPIQENLDIFDQVEIKNQEQKIFQGSGEELLRNPNSLLTLNEAYDFHVGGKEQNKTDRNDYPIFALTDSRDYWTVPKPEVMLDSFDMTLTIKGEKIQLPKDSNGIGDFEAEEIWFTKVMPYFEDENDFRPYDRRDLGIA